MIITALFIFLTLCASPLKAEWHTAYERAINAMQKEQWQLAIKHLNQAIADNETPKANAKAYGRRTFDYFPYLCRGIAFYKIRNFDKAYQDFLTASKFGEVRKGSKDSASLHYLEDFLEVLEKRHKMIDEIFVVAVALLRQKKYDSAIAKLQQVLKHSPEHAKALESLKFAKKQSTKVNKKFAGAVSFLKQNNFEAAIESFKELKRFGLEVEKYIVEAETAQLRIKKEKERLQQQQKKEQQKREKIDDLFRTGLALFNQKEKLNESKAKFMEIIKIEPKHTGAMYYLAQIKRKVAKMIEQSPLVAFGVAMNKFKYSELNEAERIFKRVLRRNPKNKMARQYLLAIQRIKEGILALYNGQIDNSIKILENLTLQYDYIADAHAFLGCAYATKFFSQREKNEKLRIKSIAEFNKVRDLQSNYTLNNKYVSPRITKLFNSVLSVNK